MKPQKSETQKRTPVAKKENEEKDTKLEKENVTEISVKETPIAEEEDGKDANEDNIMEKEDTVKGKAYQFISF